VLPQIFFCEDELHDLFSAPVVLAPAKRTQDWDRLIGDELEFNLGQTPGHCESDDLAATAIEARIGRGHLPSHGRHWPINSGNFDHVMQHGRRSKNIQISGLSIDDVKCAKAHRSARDDASHAY